MKSKINPKCEVYFDGNGAMIFNPANEMVLSYNETGKEIIGLLKIGCGKKRIIKELSKIYKVSELSLEKDLYQFLSEQKKFKVIK